MNDRVIEREKERQRETDRERITKRRKYGKKKSQEVKRWKTLITVYYYSSTNSGLLRYSVVQLYSRSLQRRSTP